MTDATAKLSNYRQSPRKVRLLADLIRGKSAARALTLLEALPKRASEPMQKLIRSAVANASKSGASANDLIVSTIQVNEGAVLKRSMPRARGRAFPIKKRTSHITVSLKKKDVVKAAAPKAAKKVTATIPRRQGSAGRE